MKKIFIIGLICFFSIFLNGCARNEEDTPIDPREDKLTKNCEEIGGGWIKYMRKDIGIYFCVPESQWGKLFEQELIQGKVWKLSFDQEVAQAAGIFYSKVDHQDNFCWDCLDFSKSNEELKTVLGLDGEKDTVVKKLNIKGKNALKITRKSRNNDGKDTYSYDWYIPRIWLRGDYNGHLVANSSVEKGMNLIIGSLEF